MATPLADLDELVLRCRDGRAKSLIAEAVSGYKAGAFRSAIVATWVAVCFDFMEKLRELALAGDASAEKQIERLEKIRTSDDVSGALSFERDLLKLARDQFEFISPIEYVDLQRLQVDRNRCAHPSLVDESSPYKPSAELVRAHIVAAVDHVLRHPPAQGKFALNRLLNQVSSEYFPTSQDAAREALQVGPLAKARESLVRNFSLVLLKDVFEKSGPDRARKIAALKAVSALHPESYKQVVADKASMLVRSLADESLLLALGPVDEVPGVQESLDVDVVQRLASFVRRLPSNQVSSLEWLANSKFFGVHAKSRISRLTRKELKSSFFFSISGPIADRYVDVYLESRSFDEANEWAKELIGNIEDFDQSQLLRLIVEGAENSEVSGSYRFSDVIHAAQKSETVPKGIFYEALQRSGLEEYAADESDVPF